MNVSSWKTLTVVTVLSLCLFIQTVGSISATSCMSNSSISALPRLTCDTNQGIWVQSASISKSISRAQPDFCTNPQIDPTRDCLINLRDTTTEVIKQCATFSVCSIDMTALDSLVASDQLCGTLSDGYTYLTVQYQCMPKTNSQGSDLTTVFMTVPVTYTNLSDSLYFATSVYPISWIQGKNQCRVGIPRDTSVTWRLLDVRGRLINLDLPCAFLFYIYSPVSSMLVQHCAQRNWNYTDLVVPASASYRFYDVVFNPLYSGNSQGQMWLFMNVTSSSASVVEKINVTCGPSIDLQPLPPTTPWSTTTATTTATPAATTTKTTEITTTRLTSTLPLLTTPTTTATTTWLAITASSRSTLYISTLSALKTDDSSDHNSTVPVLPSSGEDSERLALIIGLTIGGSLALFILLSVIICVIVARKRREKQVKRPSPDVTFASSQSTNGTGPRSSPNGGSNSRASPNGTASSRSIPNGVSNHQHNAKSNKHVPNGTLGLQKSSPIPHKQPEIYNEIEGNKKMRYPTESRPRNKYTEGSVDKHNTMGSNGKALSAHSNGKISASTLPNPKHQRKHPTSKANPSFDDPSIYGDYFPSATINRSAATTDRSSNHRSNDQAVSPSRQKPGRGPPVPVKSASKSDSAPITVYNSNNNSIVFTSNSSVSSQSGGIRIINPSALNSANDDSTIYINLSEQSEITFA